MIFTVLYDFQKFQFRKPGGIRRYFVEIQRELQKRTDVAVTQYCPFQVDHTSFKKESVFEKLIWYSMQNIVAIANKLSTVLRLIFNPPNILHPTYFDSYFLPLLKKTKLVVTVYDMIPELFPDSVFLSKKIIDQKKKLCFAADAIIAISRNTKKDLLKFYPNLESRVVVTHLGVRVRESGRLDLKRIFSDKYILFVGDRSGYKNFSWMVEQLSDWLKTHNHNLICIGGGTFSASEQKLFERLGVSNLMHQAAASDDQLAAYYAHAECLLHPSLYEGFGLPILEALQHHCMVLCSSTSCLPEVGGEACTYFDPRDSGSLPTTLSKVLARGKTKDWNKLADKQVRKYSWEKTAAKTAACYQSLV